MRPTIVLAAASTLFLAAAPRAQGQFEGVITLATPGGGPIDGLKLYFKGARERIERRGGRPGPIIIDEKGRVMMLFEDRHQYSIREPMKAAERSPRFVASPTRTIVTIAGLQCSAYTLVDPGTPQDGAEVCITSALGFLGLQPGGPMGEFNARAVQQQFPDGFFILQTVTTAGTIIRVASVERKSLADDLFRPPAGYTERGSKGAPPEL